MNAHPKIILGSRSPRRAEIMGYFALPFLQEASDFDEDALPFLDNPEYYVNQLSKGKAKIIQQRYPEDIIITADTIVYKSGKIYGKPRDEEDAFRSFQELVGEWHTVYTGVTVSYQKKTYQQVEATRVLFNPLTPEQIRHYIARTEWADKAAGYAIQMAGGLIVKKIEGCYYNVMGLPINTVEALLKKVGIELWDYL